MSSKFCNGSSISTSASLESCREEFFLGKTTVARLGSSLSSWCGGFLGRGVLLLRWCAEGTGRRESGGLGKKYRYKGRRVGRQIVARPRFTSTLGRWLISKDGCWER